jgi:uncharacterized protein (TIGR02271 family)
MMQQTNANQDVSAWIGHAVIDTSDDKIGKVADIYLDDETGEPAWASVKTGLFGNRIHFVPLAGASGSGEDLKVRYEKEQVTGAPSTEDDGHLSLDEEAALYRHYGLYYAEPSGAASIEGQADEDAAPDEAQNLSGSNTDSAMTRSEEELQAGTRTTETGRARLRKYIVTEQQQITVPVRREVVRVVTEPITAEDRDAAMDGPDLSEEEAEMILHADEVVVTTQAVPKERVRLEKGVVTGQETVTADVRKEVIETEGDLGAGRPERG